MSRQSTIGKLEDYAPHENLRVGGGRVEHHWGKLHLDIEVQLLKMFRLDKRKEKTLNQPWIHDEIPFAKRFDLKFVEFGNWMNQEDRFLFMAASAITFDNLATVLGINKSEIGMSKSVAVAFGARGKGGKVAAHYEVVPYSIINLTKTMGKVSLIHEYGHALDNLISVNTKLKKHKFASGGRTTRKSPLDPLQLSDLSHGEKLFEDFFTALYQTKFKGRLGKTNSEYLESRVEVWARTFETWVAYQFEEKGITNEWGVKTISKLKANSAIYPNEAELKAVDKYIRRILKFAFKLASGKERSNLNGLGATAVLSQANGLDFGGMQPEYTILRNYDSMISTSLGRVVSKEGELKDTISAIMKLSREGKSQVPKLAAHLYTGNHAQDAFNVWHFLKTNIKYGFDKGGEEIRTPAASWANRKKRIDCEDFAIFAAAILQNMNYPIELEIVGFGSDRGMPGKWHHIFLTSGQYVVDPVMDEYGIRPEGIKDTMKIDILSGVSQSTDSVMYGIGAITPSAKDQTTIDLEVRIKPLVKAWKSGDRSEHLAREIRKMRYVIRLNGTPERDMLLPLMPYVADVDNNRGLVYYDNVTPEMMAIFDQYTKEASAEREGLGRINLRNVVRNAASTVRNAVNNVQQKASSATYNLQTRINNVQLPNGKKVGDSKFKAVLDNTAQKAKNVAKKATHTVAKFSPVVVLARGAFLTLINLNVFGLARKLWYGYMTTEYAKAHGWNLAEHAKAVKNTKAAEKRWVDMFGGESAPLRKQALKGGTKPLIRTRATKAAKGLISGFTYENINGLGVTGADDAAVAGGLTATLAAAAPIIVAMIALISQNKADKVTNGQEGDSLTNNGDGTWDYNGVTLTEKDGNLVDASGNVIMSIKEANLLILAESGEKTGLWDKAKDLFNNLTNKDGGSKDSYGENELPGIDSDASHAGGSTIAIIALLGIGAGTLWYANKKPKTGGRK